MTIILTTIQSFLWGAPLLVFILGVGIYLSIRTHFAQILMFPKAVTSFLRKLSGEEKSDSGVSSFQALCTALAATVGTGNLVGVAGAICLGGPGSVFWMWICGLFGMITKYSEVTLALHYRIRKADGYQGGPMYMISKGMGKRWNWLAYLYCCFGVIASLGVGNATQVNAMITGIDDAFFRFGVAVSRKGNLFLGLILSAMIGCVLIGGGKRIGETVERLIPVVSAAYIALCIGVLICRASYILDAFQSIFVGAFSPRAVTGGMIGSSFRALSVGCSRGVFTNEAGMGTASIAHASAEAKYPSEQGLMGIMEVFLDTILICTLSALVILVSGVPIPYGQDIGGKLTFFAFTSVYGDWVSIAIAAFLCCFAFATVLGWGLYGARCAQYLFGDNIWPLFVLLQTVAVALGAVLNTQIVWLFAEIVNGLMAIPNLIALAVLSPDVIRLTIEYRKSDGFAVSGGNYANFHQRKPL